MACGGGWGVWWGWRGGAGLVGLVAGRGRAGGVRSGWRGAVVVVVRRVVGLVAGWGRGGGGGGLVADGDLVASSARWDGLVRVMASPEAMRRADQGYGGGVE